MDKYFEIEGKNTDSTYQLPREKELQYELYRIKIELQLDLGLHLDTRRDIFEMEIEFPY